MLINSTSRGSDQVRDQGSACCTVRSRTRRRIPGSEHRNRWYWIRCGLVGGSDHRPQLREVGW